jgi:hypothetical protein
MPARTATRRWFNSTFHRLDVLERHPMLFVVRLCAVVGFCVSVSSHTAFPDILSRAVLLVGSLVVWSLARNATLQWDRIEQLEAAIQRQTGTRTE